MKKNYVLGIMLLFMASAFSQTNEIYDMNYVSFGEKSYDGVDFMVVQLKRKNMRVRAKYFADKLNGKTVAERYRSWSKNKNVICYSSGAYMNDMDASSAGLVGLTIDFGKVVNRTLMKNKLDALVVVYPNGEVDVSNLKNGNVTFSGSGVNKTYNMNSSLAVERFVEWAKDEDLTVFQTHLLAYNDRVMLGSNSSSAERERRFLVVTKNRKGETVHYIIHKEQASSLLNATNAVVNYLNAKSYTVESLINLDTGAQDVFEFYNYDGTVSSKLQGKMGLKDARNLIVYYYE